MKVNDKVTVISEDSPLFQKKGKVTEIYDDGTVDVRIELDKDDKMEYFTQNFLNSELGVISNDNINEGGLNMQPKKDIVKNKIEVVGDINNKGDLIKDYVTFEDIDGNKIPTWFFIDKIAAAEGLNASDLIAYASSHGYNLYVVEAEPNFSRVVVADKKLNSEEIFNDYASYLQGNAKVIKMQ